MSTRTSQNSNQIAQDAIETWSRGSLACLAERVYRAVGTHHVLAFVRFYRYALPLKLILHLILPIGWAAGASKYTRPDVTARVWP